MKNSRHAAEDFNLMLMNFRTEITDYKGKPEEKMDLGMKPQPRKDIDLAEDK